MAGALEIPPPGEVPEKVLVTFKPTGLPERSYLLKSQPLCNMLPSIQLQTGLLLRFPGFKVTMKLGRFDVLIGNPTEYMYPMGRSIEVSGTPITELPLYDNESEDENTLIPYGELDSAVMNPETYPSDPISVLRSDYFVRPLLHLHRAKGATIRQSSTVLRSICHKLVDPGTQSFNIPLRKTNGKNRRYTAIRRQLYHLIAHLEGLKHDDSFRDRVYRDRVCIEKLRTIRKMYLFRRQVEKYLIELLDLPDTTVLRFIRMPCELFEKIVNALGGISGRDDGHEREWESFKEELQRVHQGPMQDARPNRSQLEVLYNICYARLSNRFADFLQLMSCDDYNALLGPASALSSLVHHQEHHDMIEPEDYVRRTSRGERMMLRAWIVSMYIMALVETTTTNNGV